MSGDSGSMGDMGMTRVGEAGVLSSNKGRVEGGKIVAVGGVFGGGVAGVIADGSVAGGGVAETDRGERSSSLSSSKSHSNSTSFCLLLVRFAGGEWTSGDESGSWSGGGGEGASSVETPLEEVTGRDDCTGSSPTAVATCPRLCQR